MPTQSCRHGTRMRGPAQWSLTERVTASPESSAAVTALDSGGVITEFTEWTELVHGTLHSRGPLPGVMRQVREGPLT